MSSEDGRIDGARTTPNDPGVERDDSTDEPAPICCLCQTPIDGGVEYRHRGKPVHVECSVEGRRGVSLGIPGE